MNLEAKVLDGISSRIDGDIRKVEQALKRTDLPPAVRRKLHGERTVLIERKKKAQQAISRHSTKTSQLERLTRTSAKPTDNLDAQQKVIVSFSR